MKSSEAPLSGYVRGALPGVGGGGKLPPPSILMAGGSGAAQVAEVGVGVEFPDAKPLTAASKRLHPPHSLIS
ncbi:hypothetical protein HYQ46_010394 [Verticillium longisporum]|nr:hypothetical protein HYQ46_010394 [Verticillium longisporum]